VLLLLLLRYTVKKRKAIFEEPNPKKPAPLWIRGVLVLTCTLVSFSHGSNDGQKGVGLLLVVLIAFMPLSYAIDHSVPIERFRDAALRMETNLDSVAAGPDSARIHGLALQAGLTARMMDTVDVRDKMELFNLRKAIQSLTKNADADLKNRVIPQDAVPSVRHELKSLKSAYEFAPRWAILLISVCLGIGTMFGWRRIVITIGEKIGKTHLTYAQGASAEICAAATIGVSTQLGLPVSTTHVLSSGIAGSMVAAGGIKNLQRKTIINIALAWLLTLPVTFVLSAALYFFLRAIL
jgi:PiT family inorganic phosphate transporter